MARLLITLDQDMAGSLAKHAKRVGKPRARVAKEILAEGLARQDAITRRKKLVADYLAGRAETRALLKDMESPQAELLNDGEP